MNIAPAAAGPALRDPMAELRAREAAKQAAQAFKAEVAHDAAQARQSPRFEAQETRKQFARAKLQQLRDWLKIVRKLYAQNPKGMAKALAQAFKELKAAVRAYQDAGGREMGLAGEAAAGALAPPPADPPAPEAKHDAETEPAEPAAASEPETSDPAADPEPNPAAQADGRALYDAVSGEVRKMIGEDGLDFLKTVRALTDDIKRLLEAARGQAAVRRRDKDTDKSFEAADKALKDLNEALHDADQSIRREAPEVGVKLSVAA